MSPLQCERAQWEPPLPPCFLQGAPPGIFLGDSTSGATSAASSENVKEEIARNFPLTYGQPMAEFREDPSSLDDRSQPLRVGVLFSGGQASGGHNVVSGLFDFINNFHPGSKIFGFKNGPRGLFTAGGAFELEGPLVDQYRNQGGFDMLGSGRHKVETPEQFESSLRHATELGLDGVVIIGGDDSNTNAAALAEFFKSKRSRAVVVGCPKTIDGDLKSRAARLEVPFGFDTACKIYSELIGNLHMDNLASKKHWSFVRLMGRAASHVTLECAMQTRPNLAFLSEEVAAHGLSLDDITREACDVICARSAAGKSFGSVLLPEGLIDFVPEMRALISDMNEAIAGAAGGEALAAALSPESRQLLSSLPPEIRRQLARDRDSHGNLAVAQIATEELLVGLCAQCEEPIRPNPNP